MGYFDILKDQESQWTSPLRLDSIKIIIYLLFLSLVGLFLASIIYMGLFYTFPFSLVIIPFYYYYEFSRGLQRWGYREREIKNAYNQMIIYIIIIIIGSCLYYIY